MCQRVTSTDCVALDCQPMSYSCGQPQFALDTCAVHAAPCPVTHPMALQTMQAQAAQAAQDGDLRKLSDLSTNIGLQTQLALEMPVLNSENLPYTYPVTQGANVTRQVVPITPEVAAARISRASLMTSPAVNRQAACMMATSRSCGQNGTFAFVPMSTNAFIEQ